MDSGLRAAARALASYDPLAALKIVALREDAAGLALRGTAVAQLGEFTAAMRLLRRAARLFGPNQPLARARCLVSSLEVALASRAKLDDDDGVDEAIGVLEQRGDRQNALFARLLLVRKSLLLGDVDAARIGLTKLELARAPARLVAFAELTRADVAARSLRAKEARQALARARAAARHADNVALTLEVDAAERALLAPAARVRRAGEERVLGLVEVETTLAEATLARALVVDACRREVRAGATVVSLASRPVLFALAECLAHAAPADVAREALLAAAFGARVVNESMRARLRVEIGRLRAALASVATVRATPRGFVLAPRLSRPGGVLLLLPPGSGEASAVHALLATGEAWSTSTLAAALGTSQRSVQRALVRLEAEGRAESVGRGRSKRWVAALVSEFATTLLLVPRRGRV